METPPSNEAPAAKPRGIPGHYRMTVLAPCQGCGKTMAFEDGRSLVSAQMRQNITTKCTGCGYTQTLKPPPTGKKKGGRVQLARPGDMDKVVALDRLKR